VIGGSGLRFIIVASWFGAVAGSRRFFDPTSLDSHHLE
jgi:hypothetical protein